MPDVFTKAKRSEVMSRIRSRGNKETELALAALFRRHKITGWRRHVEIKIAKKAVKSQRPKVGTRETKIRSFKVRPDFIFPKLRLAIFVDGCFWHACPKHRTQPKGNAAFWRKKISGNQIRDRLVSRTLRRNGWQVLRIWEHELVRRNEDRLIRRLHTKI